MPRLMSHHSIHPNRARLGLIILVLAIAALAGLIWGEREAADQIVEAINVWTSPTPE